MEFNRKITTILLLLTAIAQNTKSYPMMDYKNPELWQQPLPTYVLPSIADNDDDNLQSDYTIPFGDTDLLEVMDRAWREQPLIYGAEIRSPSVPRQISANRLSKKDLFSARNWGDAGLPFSVLYMNNHTSKSNQSDSKQKQAEKRPVSATVTSVQAKSNNNRSARNENANKARRQYSIIPQLFISYGWDRLPK